MKRGQRTQRRCTHGQRKNERTNVFGLTPENEIEIWSLLAGVLNTNRGWSEVRAQRRRRCEVLAKFARF